MKHLGPSLLLSFILFITFAPNFLADILAYFIAGYAIGNLSWNIWDYYK